MFISIKAFVSKTWWEYCSKSLFGGCIIVLLFLYLSNKFADNTETILMFSPENIWHLIGEESRQ